MRSRSARRRRPFDPRLPALRGPRSEWRFVSVSACGVLKVIRDLRPALKRMEPLSSFAQCHSQPPPGETQLRRNQQCGLEVGPAIPGKGHAIRTIERILHDCHLVHARRWTEKGERSGATFAIRVRDRILPGWNEPRPTLQLSSAIVEYTIAPAEAIMISQRDPAESNGSEGGSVPWIHIHQRFFARADADKNFGQSFKMSDFARDEFFQGCLPERMASVCEPDRKNRIASR